MTERELEQIAEAYARLRDGGIDAAVDFLHADIEWITVAGPEGRRETRGLKGVRAWFEAMEKLWARIEWKPDEVLDAGDHAVVLLTTEAVALRSEIALQVQGASRTWIRDDKLTRVAMYTDPAEALELAGISGAGGAKRLVVGRDRDEDHERRADRDLPFGA